MKAKRMLAIENGSGPSVMPPLVDIHPVAPESSSSAIVPVGALLAVNGRENYAIAQLAFLNGISNEIPFASLDGVEYQTIVGWEGKSIVTIRMTEFNEPLVCLNEDSVQFAAGSILNSFIPAYKYLHTGDPLRLPYIYHKLRLLEDGWEEGSPTDPFVFGGVLEFKKCTTPVSYFVALRDHDRIFGKGFDSIAHNGFDQYYRCLLRCPRAQVAQLMLDMVDKDSNWFKNKLKSFVEEDDPILEDGPLMNHRQSRCQCPMYSRRALWCQ